jgi:hypothetical protein
MDKTRPELLTFFQQTGAPFLLLRAVSADSPDPFQLLPGRFSFLSVLSSPETDKKEQQFLFISPKRPEGRFRTSQGMV